jgi:hypothetical protein
MQRLRGYVFLASVAMVPSPPGVVAGMHCTRNCPREPGRAVSGMAQKRPPRLLRQCRRSVKKSPIRAAGSVAVNTVML